MCTESIHIKIPSQSQIIFETKIYERISEFVCGSVCMCDIMHRHISAESQDCVCVKEKKKEKMEEK